MKMTQFKVNAAVTTGLGWIAYIAGCGLATKPMCDIQPTFTPWHPWWALTAVVGTAVFILGQVATAEPRVQGLTTDEQDLLDTYRKTHTSD